MRSEHTRLGSPILFALALLSMGLRAEVASDSKERGPVRIVQSSSAESGPLISAEFGETFSIEPLLQLADVVAASDRLTVGGAGLGQTARMDQIFQPFGTVAYRMIGATASPRFTFTALFSPYPRYRCFPFLEAQEYPVHVTVVNSYGGVLFRQEVARVQVSPIIQRMGDEPLFWLTANGDVGHNVRHQKVSEISFPDGHPVPHPQGTGSATSELLDGTWTHSGTPSWESVSWQGDWGPMTKRIDYLLTETSRIQAVCITSPSPYANYRIDSLAVHARLGEAAFSYVGGTRRVYAGDGWGTQLMVIDHLGVTADAVRVEVSQDGNATHMLLSEVYILGF